MANNWQTSSSMSDVIERHFLNDLMLRMTRFYDYGRPKAIKIAELVSRRLIAVRCSTSGLWFRGRITNVIEKPQLKITVWLIDYDDEMLVFSLEHDVMQLHHMFHVPDSANRRTMRLSWTERRAVSRIHRCVHEMGPQPGEERAIGDHGNE